MTTDIDYHRATIRLFRFAIAFAIAGTLVAGFTRGLPGAVGFALGSAASLVSLSLWRRVATKIGPPLPDGRGTEADFGLVPHGAASMSRAEAEPELLSRDLEGAVPGVFQKPARKSGPSTAFLVGRFLALLAVAYVIVKTLDVNVMAALSGLFVSAAAVIIEVLFELITFRRPR